MLRSLLQYEVQRYRNKGLSNCIVALTLLVAFHTGLHYIGSLYWNPNI